MEADDGGDFQVAYGRGVAVSAISHEEHEPVDGVAFDSQGPGVVFPFFKDHEAPFRVPQ